MDKLKLLTIIALFYSLALFDIHQQHGRHVVQAVSLDDMIKTLQNKINELKRERSSNKDTTKEPLIGGKSETSDETAWRDDKDKEDEKRAQVVAKSKPVTIRICSQNLFKLFMKHICPLQIKKKRQEIEDVTLTRERARNFLRSDTRHSGRSKRSSIFGGNGVGDIFFMDECCTSRGCDLHEINEYCV